MGEDLKAVLPCHRDQRHAGVVAGAYRAGRRRGHCDDHRDADRCRLLHHLDTDKTLAENRFRMLYETRYCQKSKELVIMSDEMIPHP